MADFEVLSFRGHALNADGRYGFLSANDSPLSRQGNPELQRSTGIHPLVARVLNTSRPVSVHIMVEGEDIRAEMEALDRIFALGARGPLAVEVEGGARVLDVVVTGSITYSAAPNVYTARVLAANPSWRSESVVSVDEVLTESGDIVFANDGNATDAWPVLQLQSGRRKAPADSWQYFADVIVANRVPREVADWVVDITDGGWDHAAEVAANRSESSGDDVRILIDGVEAPRWAGSGTDHGWDEDETKIWVNLSFGAARTVKTLAAMTGTSPANGQALVLTADSDVSLLPPSGTLLIEDEAIDYSGVVERNAAGYPELRRVVRGVRGTSADSHGADTALYLVEHRVQVMWGWDGASVPAERPDLEPVIDLENSTNTSIIWDANFFDTEQPRRSMQWQRSRNANNVMAAGILAPGDSPTASLSFEYSASGARVNEPEFNAWSHDFPTGIAVATADTIDMSRSIDPTLALIASGRDGDGNSVVLQEESGEQDTGSSSPIGNLAGAFYSLSLAARSQVFAGYPLTAATASPSLVQTTYADASSPTQQFTAPLGGDIHGVSVNLDVSGTPSLALAVFADTGSDAPDFTAGLLAEEVIASPTIGKNTVLFSTPIEARDGQAFWIAMKETGTGSVDWERVKTPLVSGQRAGAGAALATGMYQFAALSRNIEARGPFGDAADSDGAAWDSVTVKLDPASALVVSGIGERHDAYYLDATLRNFATGETFEVRHLSEPGDMVEIDVASRTALDVCGAPAALTISGDVLMDHGRALSIEGDGLPVGSGAGVWAAATNLVTNGGFETNTTGWTTNGVGVTLTRVTTASKFGAASCKVEASNNGSGIVTTYGVQGIPISASTAYTISAWVKKESGADLSLAMNWYNAGGGGISTTGATAVSAVIGEFVRVSTTVTSPAAAAFAAPQVTLTSGVASVFYVDGVQVEACPVATPYIETDGGTALRSAARVEIPIEGFFTATQGWAACRVSPEWASGGSADAFPAVFSWGDDADNAIEAYYNRAGNTFRIQRYAGGSGTDTGGVSLGTFAAGDRSSLVARWTATRLDVSVDGGAFVGGADANVPAITSGFADILRKNYGGTPRLFDGESLWFAFGQGELTDQDAAALDGLLQQTALTLDEIAYLLPDSRPTALWSGVCDRIEVAGAPRGQLLPLAISASNRSTWLALPPGDSRIRVEEEGLTGLRVAVTGHDRWQ